MAAPPEVTINDLSGRWIMDKTLSDDPTPILTLQGIGWLTRKAIGLATLTLTVKQYTEEGVIHIDIDQTATGGIKGTTELRTLNWEYREHVDHVFGSVKGKARYLNLDAVTDDFLKSDWIEEGGTANGEKHIESYVESIGNGWTADQIWGFSIVDGKRYYTRKVVVTKGSEVLKARLVYSWQGK